MPQWCQPLCRRLKQFQSGHCYIFYLPDKERFLPWIVHHWRVLLLFCYLDKRSRHLQEIRRHEKKKGQQEKQNEADLLY